MILGPPYCKIKGCPRGVTFSNRQVGELVKTPSTITPGTTGTTWRACAPKDSGLCYYHDKIERGLMDKGR